MGLLLQRVIHKNGVIEKVKKGMLILFTFILFSSCNKEHELLPLQGKVYFNLINNNYFSVTKTKQVKTIGKRNDSLEVFFFEKVDSVRYLIRSNNGFYLSYDNPNLVLFANQKEKRNAGIFAIVAHKEYFYLKTQDGIPFVRGKQNGVWAKKEDKILLFSIKNGSHYQSNLTSINRHVFTRLILQLLILIGLVYLYFKYLRKNIKETLSYKTLIVIAFIGLFTISNNQKWNFEKVISHDSLIYYEYLPAALVFNDMSFNFLNNKPFDYNGRFWVTKNEKTGRKTIKFTMGMAVMYLPFFVVGHLGAILLDYTPYGYSLPYTVMLCFCGWFYALIGLFYLRKLLLLYYSDIVSSFTLVSIALGTNMFYYTTLNPTMTHPVSFCLITMFLWYTIKWYNKKSFKTVVILGMLMGIISLIRPTNALVALVFMLFNIGCISDIKERLLLFWKYKLHIFIIMFWSIMVWIPQFFFWKYSSGEWFYFSYGEEGFFFSNPQIFNGLFSYRKGWLVYTPLMLFSLVGIFFTFKNNKSWASSLSVFVPLNIFIIYSWWCWWYGGSFGSRPMIDSYGLMAISLASFYQYFQKFKVYRRAVPLLIIFVTISLNIFQSYQTKTCLHYDSMCKESYWNNFAVLGWPDNYNDLLEPPDYSKAIKGEEEYNLK